MRCFVNMKCENFLDEQKLCFYLPYMIKIIYVCGVVMCAYCVNTKPRHYSTTILKRLPHNEKNNDFFVCSYAAPTLCTTIEKWMYRQRMYRHSKLTEIEEIILLLLLCFSFDYFLVAQEAAETAPRQVTPTAIEIDHERERERWIVRILDVYRNRNTQTSE